MESDSESFANDEYNNSLGDDNCIGAPPPDDDSYSDVEDDPEVHNRLDYMSEEDANIVPDEEYYANVEQWLGPDVRVHDADDHMKEEIRLHLLGAIMAQGEHLQDGVSANTINIILNRITSNWISLDAMIRIVAKDDQKCRANKANFMALPLFQDIIEVVGVNRDKFKPKSNSKNEKLLAMIAVTGDYARKRRDFDENRKVDEQEKPANKVRNMHANNFLVRLIDWVRCDNYIYQVKWQQVQDEFKKIFDPTEKSHVIYQEFKDVLDLDNPNTGQILNKKVMKHICGRGGLKVGLSQPIFHNICIVNKGGEGDEQLYLELNPELHEEHITTNNKVYYYSPEQIKAASSPMMYNNYGRRPQYSQEAVANMKQSKQQKEQEEKEKRRAEWNIPRLPPAQVEADPSSMFGGETVRRNKVSPPHVSQVAYDSDDERSSEGSLQALSDKPEYSSSENEEELRKWEERTAKKKENNDKCNRKRAAKAQARLENAIVPESAPRNDNSNNRPDETRTSEFEDAVQDSPKEAETQDSPAHYVATANEWEAGSLQDEEADIMLPVEETLSQKQDRVATFAAESVSSGSRREGSSLYGVPRNTGDMSNQNPNSARRVIEPIIDTGDVPVPHMFRTKHNNVISREALQANKDQEAAAAEKAARERMQREEPNGPFGGYQRPHQDSSGASLSAFGPGMTKAPTASFGAGSSTMTKPAFGSGYAGAATQISSFGAGYMDNGSNSGNGYNRPNEFNTQQQSHQPIMSSERSEVPDRYSGEEHIALARMRIHETPMHGDVLSNNANRTFTGNATVTPVDEYHNDNYRHNDVPQRAQRFNGQSQPPISEYQNPSHLHASRSMHSQNPAAFEPEPTRSSGQFGQRQLHHQEQEYHPQQQEYQHQQQQPQQHEYHQSQQQYQQQQPPVRQARSVIEEPRAPITSSRSSYQVDQPIYENRREYDSVSRGGYSTDARGGYNTDARGGHTDDGRMYNSDARYATRQPPVARLGSSARPETRYQQYSVSTQSEPIDALFADIGLVPINPAMVDNRHNQFESFIRWHVFHYRSDCDISKRMWKNMKSGAMDPEELYGRYWIDDLGVKIPEVLINVMKSGEVFFEWNGGQ